MKKLFTLFAAATSFAAISNANIKEYAIYTLVAGWDVADAVELDAGDEALDTNPTTPGLFESIFGDISGNTICRSDFKAAVAAAHAANKGGVIDFESTTYSANDWIHPTLGTPINRTGADAIQTAGATSIIINRGPQWWFEGDYNVGDANGSPTGGLNGKDTAGFDGTGPAGPDRYNPDEIFFIVPQTSSSKDELGTTSLGQTGVYDLDFDPADEIIIVGFAFLNYDNYQSQQDPSKNYVNYPNIHAIATFTNGVDTVEQMAVGLTTWPSGGDPKSDHYFGFEAPAGYYLDSLLVYQIGNNGRGLPFIDDLGFVQASPAGPAVLAAEDVTITTNGTGVDVSFLSESGLLYTLEESSDLNAPWCDLPGPITGDGTVKTFNVDPAPAAGKAFYRVRSE